MSAGDYISVAVAAVTLVAGGWIGYRAGRR